MTNETDRYISVIAKLIKLTQQGKLQWSTLTDFDSITKDPREQILSGFITTYKSTILRILKKKYSIEGDDTISFVFRKTANWVIAFVLQMIDKNGLEIWTFPKVEATEDLFAAVQYQVADVKGFIEDVLNES